MSDLSLGKIVEQLDAAHRELARLAVCQAQGVPSTLGVGDILESKPVLLKQKTVDYLRKLAANASNDDVRNRSERALFACMDLAIEQRTASLGDMLRFYMEHGRMNIGNEKIPALDIVPWLQKQDNFEKRELMRVDSTIFLKKIVNPILLGMVELTVRTVREKFGYSGYSQYCEAKKQVSFDEWQDNSITFLRDTASIYKKRMTPWVEQIIGRPFENINRYHALRLLRINGFDDFVESRGFSQLAQDTFLGLGISLFQNPGIFFEIEKSPLKNSDALCVGIDIPGEIYVIMNPAGGLIDLETLLHETGHAAFLSCISADLPIEYRRFYRSSSLDEAFAFLFMGLVENPAWLTQVGAMSDTQAEALSEICFTKKLCLMRRYIGKFLAEKEYFDRQNLKNSDSYCTYLGQATDFEYEPEGYLVDMESDFYSLDYVMAWSGAAILRKTLEEHFGENWFSKQAAGNFLREIASYGRRPSLSEVLEKYCSCKLTLPDLNNN